MEVSAAVFLPLIGAALIMAVPKRMNGLVWFLAGLFAVVPLVLSIGIAFGFDYSDTSVIQWETDVAWIPTIGARFHMGLDGLSLPLFVLTFVITFLCIGYSIKFMPEPRNPKAFFALILALTTGMAGTFVALDLVLFFVFWELVLVPMYFLIAVWGGARREYAAIKFFLYTLFGSIFMLLGFIALYLRSDVAGGERTFDMIKLAELGAAGAFSKTFALVVFGGMFLGFAVKVPMWPFHTWLPDAHTEAPTVGSVILAAILLKMGTYGFVRISLPILPEAAVEWAPWIGLLSVIAIIYAALACLAQNDMKRLIAFSSVGHMGFVMLGISTLTDRGINGAIFGMVVHGLITGMLFFVVGSIHERFHTRDIGRLGGMITVLPWMGGILTYVSVASLGLPGLAGFWGEFFALLGSFNPAAPLSDLTSLYRLFTALGLVGTLLTAGYFLWLLQRVNLGKIKDEFKNQTLADVSPIEWLAWTPLLIAILAVGIWPRFLLDVTNDAVGKISALFGG